MTRIMIRLTDSEREALKALAQQERRDPRAQAALLVRKGLEISGIMQPEIAGTQQQPAPAGSGGMS